MRKLDILKSFLESIKVDYKDDILEAVGTLYEAELTAHDIENLTDDDLEKVAARVAGTFSSHVAEIGKSNARKKLPGFVAKETGGWSDSQKKRLLTYLEPAITDLRIQKQEGDKAIAKAAEEERDPKDNNREYAIGEVDITSEDNSTTLDIKADDANKMVSSNPRGAYALYKLVRDDASANKYSKRYATNAMKVLEQKGVRTA